MLELFFLLSFLIGLRLIRSLFEPIKILRTAMEFIRDHEFSTRMSEVGQKELDPLIEVNNRMAESLRRAGRSSCCGSESRCGAPPLAPTPPASDKQLDGGWQHSEIHLRSLMGQTNRASVSMIIVGLAACLAVITTIVVVEYQRAIERAESRTGNVD